MDSKQQRTDDDNEQIFQDLTPEQPANTFKKSIIHIQHNWPPHWNKRHLLILLPVLSGLLIFFILFEFILPLTASQDTQTNVTQINNNNGVIPYDNVIYVLLNQTLNNYDQLEALNAKTGMLVWNYDRQNIERINLFSDILYIQTNTNLVAFNANTRTQLWEKPFSDAYTWQAGTWQADQGILFIESTNNLVTALNISTGTQLWATQQPSRFWQVDHGIFYTESPSGSGLNAFNAHNGQPLWYNANISQNVIVSNGNFYLQSSEKQSIQAFSGQTGKQLWQLNTHEYEFSQFTPNGFLVLSNIQSSNVEVINSQTGKLLWQRQGTLINSTNNSLNQTIISPTHKHETDIIRTTDDTILYRIPRTTTIEEVLLSIENGIAFFQYGFMSSIGNYSQKVEAIRISNGAMIWTGPMSKAFNGILAPQNGTIDMVLTGNTSLLSLRADNGHTLWQHTFGTTSN